MNLIRKASALKKKCIFAPDYWRESLPEMQKSICICPLIKFAKISIHKDNDTDAFCLCLYV